LYDCYTNRDVSCKELWLLLHLQQENKTKTTGGFIRVERLTAISAKHIAYLVLFWEYDHSFGSFIRAASIMVTSTITATIRIEADCCFNYSICNNYI